MSAPILVPSDLWDDDDDEAVVTNWWFDDGATVTAGAVVVEVMHEKTQHEVVAPCAGVLRISAAVDAVVTKGSTLGTIES